MSDISKIIQKVRDFLYNYVGGNKTILDYIEGEKIKFETDFKGLEIDGNDLLIKSSSGALTLQNVANKLIDISGSDEVTAAYAYITNREGVVDFSNFPVFGFIAGAANLTNLLIAGAGGSSLLGNGGNNTLQGGAGKDFFIYSGGNDTVDNYQNDDVIIFDAAFTGIGISGSSFAINSNNGAVNILDAVDKIIDVANGNGNISAHVYMSSNAMNIDGRGLAGLEVIIGGSNGGDVIQAGDGGSSLWGGDGNFNDSIYGGAGQDEIFYTTGNGNDEIASVSSEDVINLLGVNLNQISGAMLHDGGSYLKFNDGGTLNIVGRAGKFILEGKTYLADYENKRWVEEGGNVDSVGSTDNSAATLTRTEGTNDFTYSNGEGDVVITDYVEGQDVIKLNSGLILNTSYDGDDVIFMVGGDYITVKNGKGKNITITDAFGNTSTANYTPSEMSENWSEEKIDEKISEISSMFLEKYVSLFKDEATGESSDSVEEQISELRDLVSESTVSVKDIIKRIKELANTLQHRQEVSEERLEQLKDDTLTISEITTNLIDAVDLGETIENMTDNPDLQKACRKILTGASGSLFAITCLSAFISSHQDLKELSQDEDLMDAILESGAQAAGLHYSNVGNETLSTKIGVLGSLAVGYYNANVEAERYSQYLEGGDADTFKMGVLAIDGLISYVGSSSPIALLITTICSPLIDMASEDFKMQILDSVNGKSTVRIDDLHGDIYTANKIAKVIDASARENAIEIRASTVDNTIIGGSGNDTLIGDYRVDNSYNANSGQDPNHKYIDTAHGSDTFVYFNGGGYDVIKDYRAGEDIIKLSDCDITDSSLDGSDVILKIGEGSITVKNAKGKKITVEDKYGNFDTIKNDGIINATVQYNGHSYYLFNLETTWTEAKKRCESMGGHLVTITDEGEQENIENLMKDFCAQLDGYWLGGFKSNSRWQWVTGENFDYKNFSPYEPNGSGDYLQIYAPHYETSWAVPNKWDDTTVDCSGSSGKNGFICEWDYTRSSSADIINDADIDSILNVGISDGVENFTASTNFENLNQADSINSILTYSKG